MRTDDGARERSGRCPLRVLQLIDSIGVGGAEHVVARIAVTPMPGIDISVATLRPATDEVVAAQVIEAGAAMATFPMTACNGRTTSWRASAPGELARLVRYVRAGRFDVIHTHLHAADVVGAVVGRICRIPVVSTEHSIGGKVAHPLRQRIREAVLRHGATEVVAVGEAVASAHRTQLRDRPITVIPNPAPEAVPTLPRDDVRQALGIGPGIPLLLAVGRLEPPKDHACLLQALALVVRTRPEAVLLIVGNGSREAGIRRQLASLHLEGSVRLLGLRHDVGDLLNAADLFVSSSAWEGMPLSILEAMAAGLPVVATDVGDCRHLIGGGGIAVPPGDPAALSSAVLEVLEDPAKRRRLGTAARRRASTTFGVDRWVRDLGALYRRAARPAPV